MCHIQTNSFEKVQKKVKPTITTAIFSYMLSVFNKLYRHPIVFFESINVRESEFFS